MRRLPELLRGVWVFPGTANEPCACIVDNEFLRVNWRRHEADQRKPHLGSRAARKEALLHTTIGDIAKESWHTVPQDGRGSGRAGLDDR
jgi:hypothetical protein